MWGRGLGFVLGGWGKWRVAVVGTGDGVWLCKRPRPVGWTCQRPGVIPLSIPYQKNHTIHAPAFLYNPCVPYNLSLFPERRCKAMPGKKPQETKRQL